MKINYRILWIDDQIDDFISAGLKDEFIVYLTSLGFEADVDYYEDGQLALEQVQKYKYDLILSDYNFDVDSSDLNGDELIRRIREGEIFTEVLFYSAQPNFHDIATNLYQDRITFFNMTGNDALREFKKKVIRLIGLTVAKFQEINSMRGLVMAHTSELDNIVENILHNYFNTNDREDNKEGIVKAKGLKKYILDIIGSSIKGNSNKLQKMHDMSYLDIINERIFDADKKARAINKILEMEGMNEENTFKDFHETYKIDVLETRNRLAHARSETISGIDYLITVSKEGEQALRIDESQCKDIRNNLRKYSGLLQEIKQRVCPDM